MNALDTNLLVRYLTNDDPAQAQAVLALLEAADAEGQQYLVPQTVVLELLWVLDSGYGLGRPDILSAIEALTSLPMLKFEHEAVLPAFVAAGRHAKTDLSDLLIGLTARHLGARQVLTFDRKAARSPLFKLVPHSPELRPRA